MCKIERKKITTQIDPIILVYSITHYTVIQKTRRTKCISTTKLPVCHVAFLNLSSWASDKPQQCCSGLMHIQTINHSIDISGWRGRKLPPFSENFTIYFLYFGKCQTHQFPIT